MTKIGLVQTTTGLDPARNAAGLSEAVEKLADAGAKTVFLPEMCGILDRDRDRLRRTAASEDGDQVLAALVGVARKRRVAVAVGSLAIRDPRYGERLANRSFVIDANGDIIARYDKIHLFDAEPAEGERYRESATFAAGGQARLAALPWGLLGLAICYDLRFPALHSLLAQEGAVAIAQPSAFTVPTGMAHWHVLLRARAIETGAFIIAAAQTGSHEDGRRTYGHSLVVNPDGVILLDMGDRPGTALVDINPGEVREARRRLPALRHSRPIGAPAADAR